MAKIFQFSIFVVNNKCNFISVREELFIQTIHAVK
jgi:hypothetical protein